MSDVPTLSYNDEEHPRNAGAIRTAILLGAVFIDRGNHWRIEGIEGWWLTRSLPAFLFLATHGIGIDNNGSPSTRMYQHVPHTPRG